MKDQKTIGWTSEELNAALLQVADYFERAVCPFLLLDETARSVKVDSQVKGKRIDIGVKRKHLARSTGGILRMLIKDLDEGEKVWKFKVKDVPVKMKILERESKYTTNPDGVVYRFDDYFVPNPFEGYWKVRGLIR